MHTDRYGLPISTNSDVARDAYVEAVDCILASNAGASAKLERAIEADPDFGLPHAAMARVRQLEGDAPGARASADRARELLLNGTSREQRHGEIFSLLVNGRGQDALALLREHLGEAPRDALALSPACGVFGLIGFSGRVGREPEQLDLLEPLVSAYGEDWWFLTSYAFALVETGDWIRGRACMERSLAIEPRSAHGAHIFAHALYEAGENQTALAYLADWMPGCSPHAPLNCHLWWHVALLQLMTGDPDSMWQTYDAHCAPSVSVSPAINVVSDGVSLMWRAGLAGAASETPAAAAGPERWNAVRQFSAEKFPAPMVFVDTHQAMALAAAGDETGLETYLEALERADRDGKLPAGHVPADLGRAFSAYARKDWADAVRRLESVWPAVVRIGGSRAQRDLVRNTLLAAYVHDGHPDAAKAFLDAVEDRCPAVGVAGLA